MDSLCIDWSSTFSFFYQRPFTDITHCRSGKCIIAPSLSPHIIRISQSLFYKLFFFFKYIKLDVWSLVSWRKVSCVFIFHWSYLNTMINHSILNLNTETGNLLLLKFVLKYNEKFVNFYKDRAVTSSLGQPPKKMAWATSSLSLSMWCY